ncbi:MAG: DUF6804 family protein [Planctomycetota bacterium]
MDTFDSIFFVSSFMWFIIYFIFVVYTFTINKNLYVTILNIGRVIATVLLLVAACKFRLGYSYYTILRFIIFGVSFYCAWFALKSNHKVWVGFFIVIAILFNPIILIHLQKTTWHYIDIVTVLVFLISVLFLSKSNVTNNIDITVTKISEDNLDVYNYAVMNLYEQGYYEEALIGLQKLSVFKDEYKYILVPYIEKCSSIINCKLTDEDKKHQSNKKILERFGWIDNIKYIAGFQALLLFIAGSGASDEETEEIIRLTNWWVLGLAILLGIITVLIHIYMKKFIASKNLIRCKYCGHHTQYIAPNEPTMGFLDINNCAACGRMYPVPDSYWDSWGGLEYINGRRSVPDTQFYEEYKQLKIKYEKEYQEWLKEKKEEA